MGKSFNSSATLISDIRKRAKAVVEQAIVRTYNDAHRELDVYYASKPHMYVRTFMMHESPVYEISGGGLDGKIYLDTGYGYPKQGISTEEIFNLANSGELVGHGGFWERIVADAKRNIEAAVAAQFG